mmetsp:Transcript_930/g.2482  ORF Transcript_930/g.2482 Transcript_930/m.2482 type:complete len:211 (+) Transcript_930:310-942(+)
MLQEDPQFRCEEGGPGADEQRMDELLRFRRQTLAEGEAGQCRAHHEDGLIESSREAEIRCYGGEEHQNEKSDVWKAHGQRGLLLGLKRCFWLGGHVLKLGIWKNACHSRCARKSDEPTNQQEQKNTKQPGKIELGVDQRHPNQSRHEEHDEPLHQESISRLEEVEHALRQPWVQGLQAQHGEKDQQHSANRRLRSKHVLEKIDPNEDTDT